MIKFCTQTIAKLLNKFIQVCLSENLVNFQLKHPHALLDQFFKNSSEGLSEVDAHSIEISAFCKHLLQTFLVAPKSQRR